MQNKIIHFETIDSTNTYCLLNFKNLEDKTVVIADEQTSGRGRFDRVWVSENCDNIYLTFVLKPEIKSFVTNLTQYLSVVVAEVIESYGVEAHIKYPNDVLVNGKKICGILCEASLQKNILQGVVLGVGINLNMPENIIKSIDRPATSLNLEIGNSVDKQEFLNKLLNEFYENYEKVAENGFSCFKNDYMKRIHFIGKTIWVQQRDGFAKDKVQAQRIDSNGNLVVKTQENIEKIVYSGDILLD